MPSMVPMESTDKLARLRIEQVKLEDENRVVQERKRRGLAVWERAEREAVREGLKVELAERALEGVVDGY